MPAQLVVPRGTAHAFTLWPGCTSCVMTSCRVATALSSVSGSSLKRAPCAGRSGSRTLGGTCIQSNTPQHQHWVMQAAA
jgi:hypothetical protein